MLERAYITVTPDPLPIGNLERTLQVISEYGTATPSVGVHTYLVNDILNPSVSLFSGYLNSTQYICTGWAMTGNAPASGATNFFTMTVADNAVLTWNWSLYNVAPVITNTVSMLALRTKPSTITEAALLAPAYDPLEPLTVSAVVTTSTKGSTITWAGGILGYTPPATNRLGFEEYIQYTVSDGHGAETTGTLIVTVPPAGTAIRVF